MASLDGLPPPRKYWALAVTMLGMAMTVLETTITNVALPSIAQDLGITPAQAVWVVNTYQLAIVVALLPFSSLGEILGYRRVFIAGLATFTAASLGCALAGDFTTLISFRVIQGLGAAAAMSVSAALMRFIYSQREFGRAIGYNALVVATSSAAGPMVGSLILSVASWPWVFVVNVPIGLFILAVGGRMLPDVERAKRPFDALSALLSGLTFGLLVVGIDRLLPDPKTALLLLAVSAVAGVALVKRELAQPTPLLPLDLLRIRPFAFSVAASILAFSGQSIAYIALPFYFHSALNRSALELGVLMVPWPIAVAISAPLAGRASEKIPPSILCSVGAGMVAAGLVVVALLPASISNSWVIVVMAFAGIGFGMFQTPNNRVMLTAAPRHRSGGAGGLQATARQFGMAFGAAAAALAFMAAPAHGATTGLLLSAVFLAASAAVSAGRPGTRPTL